MEGRKRVKEGRKEVRKETDPTNAMNETQLGSLFDSSSCG